MDILAKIYKPTKNRDPIPIMRIAEESAVATNKKLKSLLMLISRRVFVRVERVRSKRKWDRIPQFYAVCAR